MGKMCNGYAKAINRQRDSTGHLFESKYKIRLVNSNEYLIWLTRYIHRNPVEPSLVDRCRRWKYSSYQNYLGFGGFGSVEPSDILSLFGSVVEYEKFVEGAQLDMPEKLSADVAAIDNRSLTVTLRP